MPVAALARFSLGDFFFVLVLSLTEPDVAWHLRSPIFKAFHWERSYRAQNQSGYSDQVKVLHFNFFYPKKSSKTWKQRHSYMITFETNLVLIHTKKLENRNFGKCTRNKNQEKEKQKSKQKVKAISIFT